MISIYSLTTKLITLYKDGTTVIMMIVIRIFLRISYDFVGDFGYDHIAIIKNADQSTWTS